MISYELTENIGIKINRFYQNQSSAKLHLSYNFQLVSYKYEKTKLLISVRGSITPLRLRKRVS